MSAAQASLSNPWRAARRRLLENRVAVAGGVLLLAVGLACLFLPIFWGLEPQVTHPELRYLAPSSAHWFGTDALGRDVFARVLVGGRTSLAVGLAATAVSVLVGVAYGAVAGYYGGRVDDVMMRVVDFLYGLPYMFLVILIMLLFAESARGQPLPVFLALGLVQWLTMARIVRTLACRPLGMSVRNSLYPISCRDDAEAGSEARPSGIPSNRITVAIQHLIDLIHSAFNTTSEVEHTSFPPERMNAWPVNMHVNNARNEGPDCIATRE